MNFFERIKKLIKSLFEREKSTEYLLEDKQSQIEETEAIDLIDDYLFSIQDILAKLELINISHGKTDELTSKLLDYNNKLSAIQNKYLDFDRNNTNIENYSKRTGYLLELSTLLDELKLFSKTYFYLEDLNVFRLVETTTENIESRKEELMELETNIYSYHIDNKEIDDRLHTTLNTIIYEMLKKEVELNTSRDLYDNLSYVSKLEIKKLFLKELAKKASENSNVKKYIDKNNITLIDFSYDNLLLFVDNTSKVNNNIELVNKNKYDKTLVGLKDLDKKIEAFSKKFKNIDNIIYDYKLDDEIGLAININKEKINFDYAITEIEIINIVETEYYYLLAGKIESGEYEVIGEVKLSSDRCETDVARIVNMDYSSMFEVLCDLECYDYKNQKVLRCFQLAFNRLKVQYDNVNEEINNEKETTCDKFNISLKNLEKKIEEFYLIDRKSKYILNKTKITQHTIIDINTVIKISEKTVNIKCPINRCIIFKELNTENYNYYYYLVVGNNNFSKYKIISVLSISRFSYTDYIRNIYIDKLSYKQTKKVIDLLTNFDVFKYGYSNIIRAFSMLYKEYMEYEFKSNKDTIFNTSYGSSYNPGEVSDGLKQLTKTLKF